MRTGNCKCSKHYQETPPLPNRQQAALSFRYSLCRPAQQATSAQSRSARAAHPRPVVTRKACHSSSSSTPRVMRRPKGANREPAASSSFNHVHQLRASPLKARQPGVERRHVIKRHPA